jgi:ribonuclease R
MIGDRTGTAYKLGDLLAVRLVEAAPLTGGMRFDLAEAAAPARKAGGRPQFKVRSQSRPRKR